MPSPKLAFYFDLHSPYAYLAYHHVRHSRLFQNCDVRYVPVQLIGMVKAGVSLPPWGRQNKVNYMWNDLGRWAREYQIPWRSGPPANFPETRTSEVQRVLVACLNSYPDRLPELLDALFDAFWVEKKGVQVRDVFEPIVESVLGTEAANEVMIKGQSEEVRKALIQNTQEAIATGAPGMPWFVVVNSSGSKEGFWGFDHLAQVARFMGMADVPSSHL